MTEDVISKEAIKKAIFSPSFKKKKKNSKKKNHMPPVRPMVSKLPVYFTAYGCTTLSACCRLRRSGNVTGSGSESVTGSETVCSEQEQVSGSETWSGTWSETWSETWTWRGICQWPCPLLMSSSLGCDWRTWSGSWNGCGS